MAAGTTAWRHAVVIENGRRPAIGCVAIVTSITGHDVVRCFSGRSCPIVAGKTGANDIGMIDSGHW